MSVVCRRAKVELEQDEHSTAAVRAVIALLKSNWNRSNSERSKLSVVCRRAKVQLEQDEHSTSAVRAFIALLKSNLNRSNSERSKLSVVCRNAKVDWSRCAFNNSSSSFYCIAKVALEQVEFCKGQS